MSLLLLRAGRGAGGEGGGGVLPLLYAMYVCAAPKGCAVSVSL